MQFHEDVASHVIGSLYPELRENGWRQVDDPPVRVLDAGWNVWPNRHGERSWRMVAGVEGWQLSRRGRLANRPELLDQHLGRHPRILVPDDDDVRHVVAARTATDVVGPVDDPRRGPPGLRVRHRRRRVVDLVANALVVGSWLDGAVRLAALEVDADVAFVRVLDH